MNFFTSRATPGSLDEFLEPGDLVPIRELPDHEWNAVRRRAFARLAWHFCTLGNLRSYRGRYLYDVIGFGWAGIFR